MNAAKLLRFLGYVSLGGDEHMHGLPVHDRDRVYGISKQR